MMICPSQDTCAFKDKNEICCNIHNRRKACSIPCAYNSKCMSIDNYIFKKLTESTKSAKQIIAEIIIMRMKNDKGNLSQNS